MSATFTGVLPARKSSKHSAIQWRPVTDDTHVAGVLTIHTDRASVAYTVSEFPTDWPGRGFLLAKETAGTEPESERYSVFCAAAGPWGDTCDCKGFTYKATCKHVDAVRALVGNAWL
ncbi:hypothetical protein [Frigoriglobus tundricola]|uniref:SWIM-type domain-containing protein n=1 Tax=Frigoriglobus tundricola TaxID=2774151 RepID=A0A6M5YIM0_9BACT|nr:hypothetical protein [Frigoriglobus tundricola]QJW93116.1 hypothetical protein FTUN_0619 [Frigoriglobus tundricola]